MFYVYEVYIIDTNEIIYVGKGTGNRYKAKKKNRLLNYLLEHNECDVRFYQRFDSEQAAFECERDRIDELKAIGQCVCNNYRGGTGGYNSVWTDEKRKEMSVNNPMKNEDQRKRMSEQNPMKNPSVAQAVSGKIKRPIVLNGVWYAGTTDAARELGVWTNTVLTWLREAHDGNGNPCRYADEEQRPYTFKKRGKPIRVNDKVFPSGKAAAEYIGIDQSLLIKAIKSGQLCKGYRVEYDNQQPSR